MYADDEKIVFAAIHPKDHKLLKRSVDNNVGVVLAYPQIDLIAICAGSSAPHKEPGKRTTTIFLTGK